MSNVSTILYYHVCTLTIKTLLKTFLMISADEKVPNVISEFYRLKIFKQIDEPKPIVWKKYSSTKVQATVKKEFLKS